MSFNTSNIQADTFTGVYSISAPIHYVDGIPISNNTGNLKLGNESNSIVECLELQSSVSVSAPLGELDLVSTAEIVPSAGIGASLLIDGNFNMQNYGISNLSSLTLRNGATGSNGQVLSVSGGSLIWKTDANDVAQWASFNAQSDVNVNFNELKNVNKLTVHNGAGAYNQVLSVDGSGFAVWKDDVNASAWSSFKATQAVDFDNLAINKLKFLTLENNAVGLPGQVLGIGPSDELIWKDDANDVAQWASFTALSNVNLNDNNIIGASSISTGNLAPKNNIGDNINVDGFLNMQGYGIAGLDSITLANGEVGADNQVLSVTSGSLFWKNDSSGDVSQWATFDAVQSVNINNNALENVLSLSGVDGEIVVKDALVMEAKDIVNANDVNCQTIHCQYKPQHTIYVSPNGSDTTGFGNIEAPYQTIQQAIDVAQSDSNNVYYYIMVMPGSYTENLTITKKINLIGMATSPYNASVGCVIGGSVTVNINGNGGDIFNNACNISGFLIGSLVSFVSTANSILNLENCYIYADDNASGRALYFNPSCANSRLRLTNTIIISGGSAGLDPLIEITSVSQTTMNNCYFSAKGLQNVLKFSGSATCDTINTVKFESSNSGANVPAIVEITATVSATYTFSNCGFIYASATNKSANAAASGIYSNSATGNNRIVALYCSFFLLGTSSQLNYAIQDAYHGGASQMIVLYYMNGASLQNAFAIMGNNNQNKFQLQIVS